MAASFAASPLLHGGKSQMTGPHLPLPAHGVGDTAVTAQPAQSLWGLSGERG